MLLIEESQNVRVLIDPDWRMKVAPGDLAMLEDLFADFIERARSDPQTLFEQCRMLNLGPLQTEEEGQILNPPQKFLDAIRQFVASS